MSEPATQRKRTSLALQGGGAHGAFTWGVLDRLLEDGRLDFAGLSGTSAGAMNATVLAYGLSQGGAEATRKRLGNFWQQISEAGKWSPLRPSPLDKLLSRGDMDLSPTYHWFDQLSRLLSPYEMNPLGFNPLRRVLEANVDFGWLREHGRIPLFVAATNVLTGKVRAFCCHEITPEAVLASACLPFLAQAVEVENELYWDGGFMGNPPIFPLIYNTDCDDVLIVQINPIEIKQAPRSAREILDRMNELSFNSALMGEMRAIAFVTKLLDEGRVPPSRYKRMNIHLIGAEVEMAELGYSSKLNTDPDFQRWLFELGRSKAEAFLNAHYDKINVTSSTDIVGKFL